MAPGWSTRHHRTDLPAGQHPDQRDPVAGVGLGQGQIHGVARLDVQLVDQQVAGLVHPVGEADPGQLDPLPAARVVVGEQRRGALVAHPAPQPAADQFRHGDGCSDHVSAARADTLVRHALRADRGRRLRQAAVAAVPPGHAEAAAQGRGRQEPAADRVRAAGRGGARRADPGLHRGRLRERGRGGAARARPGQHPGRAGGPGLAERGGLARRGAGRPRPGRGGRRGHRGPDHAPGDAPSRRRCEQGFAVAEEHAEVLVTFGVVPTTPHTGYGYLRRGPALPGHADVCAVAEFKEKPDRATAAEYLALGRLLVELRHVRLAGPHPAGPARGAAAGHLRAGHRAGRRAGAAGGDLPAAAQDQRGLRGDGAGLPGPGHRVGGRRPAADHLARRRRVRLAGRAPAAGRGRATRCRGPACWSTPGTTW